MFRIIFIGLWLSALAFGSFYYGIKKGSEHKAIIANSVNDKLNYERSEVINIPIIDHNNIKGYIITQFVYIIDNEAYTKINNANLTAFLNDVLLTKIYGKYTSEQEISKISLNDLKSELITEINNHFPKPYLKGLVIGHFTYYSLDVIKKAIN